MRVSGILTAGHAFEAIIPEVGFEVMIANALLAVLA
jgi:hypothetical protein